MLYMLKLQIYGNYSSIKLEEKKWKQNNNNFTTEKNYLRVSEWFSTSVSPLLPSMRKHFPSCAWQTRKLWAKVMCIHLTPGTDPPVECSLPRPQLPVSPCVSDGTALWWWRLCQPRTMTDCRDHYDTLDM